MGCFSGKPKPRLEECYEVGERIGRGHFAVVHRGRRIKDGMPVAVKFVDKSMASTVALSREVELLQRIGNHEDIINLVEVFETEDGLQLVLELASGGELFDRLVSGGPYSEHTAAKHIRSLLRALDFLHQQGIVHCDLKPENILLSSMEEEARALVADFGLARALHQTSKLRSMAGTWAYAAPEVHAGGGFDTKADMWSCGVLMYAILSGSHPFDPTGNLTVTSIKAAIRKGQWEFPGDLWGIVSDNAKALVSQLLQADPKARPTAVEALQHPWLLGAAPKRRVSTHIASDLSAYQTRMRTKLRAGLYVSLTASSFQSQGQLQRKSSANATTVDVNGTRVTDLKPRASLRALVAAQHDKARWGAGLPLEPAPKAAGKDAEAGEAQSEDTAPDDAVDAEGVEVRVQAE